MLSLFGIIAYNVWNVVYEEIKTGNTNVNDNYADPTTLKILIGITVFYHGIPIIINFNKPF